MRKTHNCQESRPSNNPGYSTTYIKMSKARCIFLTEDITVQVAAELSALLLHYNLENPKEEITLYLHSNGGDVSGLIHIYDIMQIIQAPIKTILMGKCYSAGAVILAAGTKGRRFALKNSSVMIHGIQFSFPLHGDDITNSNNYFSFIKENNDSIMKILAKHTNQTLAKLKQDCVRDYYMTANEAKQYGIIDHIIS